MKLCKYLSHALLGVFLNVMLPQPEDRPPVPSELPAVPPVAPHVVLNLVAPELFCKPFLLVVPVPVPKVAVAEYCYPLSLVCKVGIPIHLRMHFKLVSCVCKHLLHPQFDLCVFALDSGHDPGPFFRGEYVCHG